MKTNPAQKTRSGAKIIAGARTARMFSPLGLFQENSVIYIVNQSKRGL
jgi:hypothetical protein